VENRVTLKNPFRFILKLAIFAAILCVTKQDWRIGPGRFLNRPLYGSLDLWAECTKVRRLVVAENRNIRRRDIDRKIKRATGDIHVNVF
jgi:hypothetical protein